MSDMLRCAQGHTWKPVAANGKRRGGKIVCPQCGDTPLAEEAPAILSSPGSSRMPSSGAAPAPAVTFRGDPSMRGRFENQAFRTPGEL